MFKTQIAQTDPQTQTQAHRVSASQPVSQPASYSACVLFSSLSASARVLFSPRARSPLQLPQSSQPASSARLSSPLFSSARIPSARVLFSPRLLLPAFFFSPRLLQPNFVTGNHISAPQSLHSCKPGDRILMVLVLRTFVRLVCKATSTSFFFQEQNPNPPDPRSTQPLPWNPIRHRRELAQAHYRANGQVLRVPDRRQGLDHPRRRHRVLPNSTEQQILHTLSMADLQIPHRRRC